MQEELDAIDAASRAVERVTRKGRFAEFELSNGIVLSLKPVPPILLSAVLQEFKTPPPPKVFIEDKGREEENPNDPEYLREVEALVALQDKAVNDLVLGVGTAFKSVPEGYFPPESDEWISRLEFATSLTGNKLEIERVDPIKRYLCWLRFYAMESGTDIAMVNSLPLELGGISESEVLEAMDSFRSIPERGANTDSVSESGSENGNNSNRAARRASARNRGA